MEPEYPNKWRNEFEAQKWIVEVDDVKRSPSAEIRNTSDYSYEGFIERFWAENCSAIKSKFESEVYTELMNRPMREIEDKKTVKRFFILLSKIVSTDFFKFCKIQRTSKWEERSLTNDESSRKEDKKPGNRFDK